MAISIIISIAVRKATELTFLLFLLELGLIVFLVVDFYEAWKTLVGSNATLTLEKIDKDTV